MVGVNGKGLKGRVRVEWEKSVGYMKEGRSSSSGVNEAQQPNILPGKRAWETIQMGHDVVCVNCIILLPPASYYFILLPPASYYFMLHCTNPPMPFMPTWTLAHK